MSQSSRLVVASLAALEAASILGRMRSSARLLSGWGPLSIMPFSSSLAPTEESVPCSLYPKYLREAKNPRKSMKMRFFCQLAFATARLPCIQIRLPGRERTERERDWFQTKLSFVTIKGYVFFLFLFFFLSMLDLLHEIVGTSILLSFSSYKIMSPSRLLPAPSPPPAHPP